MKKTLLAIVALAAGISANAQTPLFTEDFNWFNDWSLLYGGTETKLFADHVGHSNYNTDYKSEDETITYGVPQIQDVKDADGKSLEDALKEKGFSFVRTNKDGADVTSGSIYAQAHYLKFGKSDNQAAIIMPKLPVAFPEGTKMTLMFDWTPMMVGKAGNYYDGTALSVVVKNGETETQFAVPAHTLATGDDWKWMNAAIVIKDVTLDQNTTVTIRPDDANWAKAKQHRWMLDNIKVYQGEVAGINAVEVDANAPVEYYNILGVKVEQPTTGVYIRRQGKSVTKVIVR